MNIVLVGAGPRNLSLLERLLAHAQRTDEETTITLFDPFPIGGRVWNPDQDPTFLMNTVTQQLTLFTDPSVAKSATGVFGPTFYEWAITVGPEFIQSHNFKNAAIFLDEIARINPNRFTSRALFGVYAQWFYENLGNYRPKNVQFAYLRKAVIDVQQTAPHMFKVLLEDGSTVDAEQVVMALGNADEANTNEEQGFADFTAQHTGLTYVPAGHPAEARLDTVPDNEPVILRGLGLNFFDYIAKLTVGRGGHFARDRAGELYYVPSGKEPKMIAGSRKGLPMHARGLNQKKDAESHRPIFFTAGNIDRFARENNGKVTYDFFFNLIEKEMNYKHYQNVISDFGLTWPFNAAEFLEALRHSANLNATAREWGVPDEYIMNWDRILNPLGESAEAVDYNEFMVKYLTWDINDALKGNVDAPYAGAFDMLRDVRPVIRHYLDAGYLDGDEYAQFLAKFNPFNSIISVGPPILRIEQMRALIKAGILTITGPGIKVVATEEGFVATDAFGHEWHAQNLVEARLHSISLAESINPLIANLRDRDIFSDQSYQKADGSTYTVGGICMNKATLTVVNKADKEVAGLYIWGVPTEGWSWFTTFAPRPGVRDKNLVDAEHIAETIFE
ncbi:FAD/NAD(P)-binding protein [Weissella soli]|uniref:FAD/NAD(P)-binding protein n=1 Tax=Weissella soli TaxID=155866 RepID=UPI0035A0BF03